MNELKPCPFCGGDPDVEVGLDYYSIRCTHCGAEISMTANPRYCAGYEVTKKWQRRDPDGYEKDMR